MTTQTAVRTNRLLTAGIVAGPLFIIVALVQAFSREGFDWNRHPTSMLALGGLGWIQITNFVVAAVLFFGCAVSIKRVLPRPMDDHAAPANP